MLLDLSTELVVEIGCKLDQEDCANLRATCKRLGDSVEHLFFSCLVLSTDRLHSTTGVEFLVALTSARTGWSRHAKRLHIKLAKWARALGGFVASKLQMWTFIAALGALQNIASVRWETSRADPEWERTALCEYLNGLPKLDELQLEIQGSVDLSLPALSRVKKLKVKDLNTPVRHLTVLEGEPPLVSEICQRVTPVLTALDLDFPPPYSNPQWSNIWSQLQGRAKDEIHLTELTTSVVTPSLFAYLTAYSGLQKLKLTPDGGNGAASDRLADMFYETALAHHASSLLTLSCPAVYEGRWSFGPHNAQHISALCNLTALEMSINAGRARTIEPSEESYRWLIDSGTRVLGHTGLRVEVEQADIDPVVTNLLRTAASLSALRSLVVLSAESENNRGTARGHERGNHRKGVNNAIQRAVRKFRLDIRPAVVVHAGNRTYQRRATAEEEDLEEEEVHPLTVVAYPIASIVPTVVLHHL